MNTIKNGLVVVMMLAVAYGMWVMLNKKPVGPPPGVMEGSSWQPPKLELASAEPVTPLAPAPQMVSPETSQGVTLSPPNEASAWSRETSPASSAPPAAPPVAPPPSSLGETPPAATSAEAPSRYAAPVVSAAEVAGQYASQTPPAPATETPAVAPEEPAPSRYSAAGWEAETQASSRYAQSEATTGEENYAPPAGEAFNTSSGGSPYERATNSLDSTAFEVAWKSAQEQVARQQYAEALFTLSLWHDSPDVPASRRPELLELLDQLAGMVVYSRAHLLESPHVVASGETLQQIADRYQVPSELLANINGVQEPANLQAGTELKVVRGPFNAIISLQSRELTLLVNRRYAGRFAIELGNDPEPMTGEYVVREKETQRTFYDREGRVIEPGGEENPYGPYWIGLGGRLGIHGAASPPASGRRDSTGSIIVSEQDARDLYGILSKHSRVEIRR